MRPKGSDILKDIQYQTYRAKAKIVHLTYMSHLERQIAVRDEISKLMKNMPTAQLKETLILSELVGRRKTVSIDVTLIPTPLMHKIIKYIEAEDEDEDDDEDEDEDEDED